MEGDGKAIVRPWWLKGQRKEQKGLLSWYTMGENLIELFEAVFKFVGALEHTLEFPSLVLLGQHYLSLILLVWEFNVFRKIGVTNHRGNFSNT